MGGDAGGISPADTRIHHSGRCLDYGAATRRPSAYGFFTADYGVFGLIRSLINGNLYDLSNHRISSFSRGYADHRDPIFMWIKKRL